MSQITYQYKALDPHGARTKGSIIARDEDEAYRRLVATGMKPIRIVGAPIRRRRRRRKKVGARELSHTCHQMAVLMEARIPIADGLRSIADQESNPQLADVLRSIADQIEAGSSVTDAVAPFRSLFGDVFVETIRAAEVSGNMIMVLGRLAQMLEHRHEMDQSVKGALLYPVCVVGSILLALTFLLIFVVPRFTKLYAARGLDLPLMTKLLVGVSDISRSYWWLILALGVGAVFLFRWSWRDRGFRCRVDALMHRAPFVRELLRGMATGRFAHVLGISLQSGLGLIESLRMAGASSARPLLHADAEKMATQINNGCRLTDVMVACAYLPGFARRMLSSGEDAGELPRMCEIVARHYDREARYLASSLTTMIEPFLIAGLAVIVLVIALGIFLPMWNMASLLG